MSCIICHHSTAPTTPVPRASFEEDKEIHNLCALCAELAPYDKATDSRAIRAICYVGNEILAEIRKQRRDDLYR